MIPAMEEVDDAELWIAGDGPIKRELEELTKTLGLDHKVKFIGKLMPEKLRAITEKAHDNVVGTALLERGSNARRYGDAAPHYGYGGENSEFGVAQVHGATAPSQASGSPAVNLSHAGRGIQTLGECVAVGPVG